MTGLNIDASRTALLSMDMQTAIISIYTKDNPNFLPRVARVLDVTRKNRIRLLHVQVGFRPGLPEVDPRNQLFGAVKSSPKWQQIFQGPAGAIHPDVAPHGDEIVITKHRVSAFAGTDLDMILRANQVDTLILVGIATSGVVLSTLLHASDADYRLVVVKDCCTDLDSEVHACLTEKFLPQRATVLTADELLQSLQSASV
ncbi:MAG: isochorismatase family cysteine hydrolase [Terracidiphilus sp.]